MIFKNILRVKKEAELAGDCRELRNCGSQILKVRNRSSATFFSPQFRNRFGCPQYCGIAEVRTKIADAYLWCIQSMDQYFSSIGHHSIVASGAAVKPKMAKIA
jgi:hypothetical protein